MIVASAGRFCTADLYYRAEAALYPRNANLLCRVIRPCANRIIVLFLSRSLVRPGQRAPGRSIGRIDRRPRLAGDEIVADLCRGYGRGWFLAGTLIALGIRCN